MKYKLIAIGTILVLLTVSIAFSLDEEKAETRYHQHIEVNPSTYAPCEHKDNELCTHLPIVAIKTTSPAAINITNTRTSEVTRTSPSAIGVTMVMPKDKLLGQNPSPFECEVQVYDREGEFNHLTDTPVAESKATYGRRGNSSYLFDKPSFKLEFFNEDGTENNDVEFLGMPKHDEWVLNGPILDKTMLRNYMSFNIAGEIMPHTPRVRHFELILDGEYAGLYLAMESIERGEDRIPLTKYNNRDPFTSYIIRADRPNSTENQLNNFIRYAARGHENSVFEVVYPPVSKQNPDLMKYIEDDLSRTEKAIYSFDYKSNKFGYPKLIDKDSFVDYFIINEFTKNADAGIYSTYYYKDIRDKLHIGPVWDFNNAYDNYMEAVHTTDKFIMTNAPMYTMLIKDPEFTEAIISRYEQLRKGVLSEEYLLNYIDNTTLWLGDSIERNNAVWGYTYDTTKVNDNNKLIPDERNPKDYDEAITEFKAFIVERGNWLDDNIDNLRQYSHPSKTKKFNH